LLADCYWGHQDDYAAYLWFRIPVEKRTALLLKEEWAHDYVASLQGHAEKNLGYEADPYYLSPLPVSHLDNEALTELVRTHPPLLNLLPALRSDGLKLTATERLALMKTSEETDPPDYLRQPPSPRRLLKSRARFKLATIQEESEVLASRDLTPDVARTIPTLAWLAESPPEAVRTLLAEFTAQDLARAWIGPDAVLAKLAECLPEKKLKLMLTYRDRLPPSRESAIFIELAARGAALRFGAAAETAEKEEDPHAPETAA
jgi:hypothetical protein